VAGPVRIFLVAAGHAGAAGETLTVWLGSLPWDWTPVVTRGAVWGAGATLLAGWLRWQAPEVLPLLHGPVSGALLSALSFATALGMVAVATADPRPAGPALGALVLAAAGIAWGRAARHAAVRHAGGRPAGPSGST
jgi:hypothetical protein